MTASSLVAAHQVSRLLRRFSERRRSGRRRRTRRRLRALATTNEDDAIFPSFRERVESCSITLGAALMTWSFRAAFAEEEEAEGMSSFESLPATTFDDGSLTSGVDVSAAIDADLAAPANPASDVVLNDALATNSNSDALVDAVTTQPGILDAQTSKSYYATLFLFVLSAPGLYSLVKRSAKSKIERKTFELPGPKAEKGAMELDDVAKEIFVYFKRNNYVVAEAGEVITFEGNIAPERGTAAYITFCVAIGLLCVGLVCSIALPGGNFWYSLVLISPLSGKYYLENAERKEKVKIKMVDNDATTDVIVEGNAEEIERFRRDLNLMEKGMIRVKGILEQ